VPGAEALDLDGRWLMPGMWDAHAHFTQWARSRRRIDVSAARSAAEGVSLLLAGSGAGSHAGSGAVVATALSPGSTVVGRGFQDALWPDAPTAEALDLAFPGLAVVVISHDLHSVWLSSAAAARFGAPHAGLVREDAAFAVQIALEDSASAAEDVQLVHDAARAAAARGVVGIRDLEMADNVASWTARVAAGFDLFRVEACIYPEHLSASDARGLPGGAEVPGTGGLVRVGALKVFADGSLNTRTALTHEPYGGEGGSATGSSVGHAARTPAELRELLRAAKERGLEVALHAIGDLAVTRALDAFEHTGARGTVEHAQLVREADLARFAALGVAASVQPQHAIDDRDVADAVWADRSERAFPYRSLADAGARLLLGSDAPVAPLDPWVTLAAAVHRSGDKRASWHPEQELTREVALAASVRGDGALVGEVADVIAVDHDPLSAAPDVLRSMPVALTVVGGRVTHRALG
jgi:predicted amidohydrolase YtcJ